MPAILDRLVQQLKDKWHSEEAAFKIATKSLQRSWNLKPGTQQATEQWEIRWAMSPDERARDRAKKLFRPKKPKWMSLPKLKF